MARSPDYQRGGISLYLGDCLEILPEIGAVDAVVTDPPYGLDMSGSGEWAGQWSSKLQWDRETACGVEQLPEIATEVVIWGGNYYQLPPIRGWMIWDKMQEHSSGHAELAWTNLNQPIRTFRLSRVEAYSTMRKAHPTQKPVALMEWCIGFTKGEKVIDPFMGSGTTGVACIKTDRQFIGIERDPTYFDIAVKRIDAALDIDRDSLWTAKQLAEQQRPLFE